MLHPLLLIATALLSSALTGWMFYLVVKRYLDNEQKKRMLEMRIDERRETLRVVSPIRLQAYERMVLFLERISPDSLVMRCFRPGMDAQRLRAAMSDAIRDEWEHNLSQQVYMSSEVWDRVRHAKDEMLNLVNSSAAAMPQHEEEGKPQDAASLAGTIFATVAKDHNPIDRAAEQLKEEIRMYWK